MTEDEAKTKWCPFSRTISAKDAKGGFDVPHGQSAFNRIDILGKSGAHLQSSTACVGGACMAWWWRNAPRRVYIATLSDGSLRQCTSEPEIGVKVEPDYIRTVVSVSTSPPSGGDGFCGLAGALR